MSCWYIGLIVVGVLAILLAIFVAWRIYATARASHGVHMHVRSLFDPLVEHVRAGHLPSDDMVRRLAARPLTRNTLYEVLRALEHDVCFPEEHRTHRAMAESSIVFWLLHPNELGAVPDHIELIEVQTRDSGTRVGDVEYYVFRFRMDPPHWHDGWSLGVAGPYHPKVYPVYVAPATMSRFSNGSELRPPSDEIDFSHDLMTRGDRYAEWVAALGSAVPPPIDLDAT